MTDVDGNLTASAVNVLSTLPLCPNFPALYDLYNLLPIPHRYATIAKNEIAVRTPRR